MLLPSSPRVHRTQRPPITLRPGGPVGRRPRECAGGEGPARTCCWSRSEQTKYSQHLLPDACVLHGTRMCCPVDLDSFVSNGPSASERPLTPTPAEARAQARAQAPPTPHPAADPQLAAPERLP